MANNNNHKHISIVVRQRTLKNNTFSLYLDINNNGTRVRENLGLYLVPEISSKEKTANLKVLAEVARIREKRLVELTNDNNLKEVVIHSNASFLEYFRAMVAEKSRTASSSDFKRWKHCLLYLQSYCNESTTFNDITPEWCEGFKKHLDNYVRFHTVNPSLVTLKEKPKLSIATKLSSLYKLQACLKCAFDENLILSNPMEKVEKYSMKHRKPSYLTWDEVTTLDSTPCVKPGIKRVFLFSCFTGMKIRDIEKLKWRQVDMSDDQAFIQMSKEYKVIIPEQAIKYLGPHGQEDDLVFADFDNDYRVNLSLRRWALDAGILKDFTFQSARNTFTYLLLSFGAENYAVASMLGYKDMRMIRRFERKIFNKKQEHGKAESNNSHSKNQ